MTPVELQIKHGSFSIHLLPHKNLVCYRVLCLILNLFSFIPSCLSLRLGVHEIFIFWTLPSSLFSFFFYQDRRFMFDTTNVCQSTDFISAFEWGDEVKPIWHFQAVVFNTLNHGNNLLSALRKKFWNLLRKWEFKTKSIYILWIF